MLLKNGTAFINGQFEQTDVLFQNGIITGIGTNFREEEVIDCTDCYILPGLVEIHSHGCVEEDFSTSTVDGISKMCNYYAQNGITSVLATTMTGSKHLNRQAMSNINEYCKQAHTGSKILGINMEGPFLGKDKKGAHDKKFLIEIDREFLSELDELSGNRIVIVDIDPCLEGAFAFIEEYKDNKIISLAHTSADYETAVKAMEAGANHITHLFNAMNSLHHREPGLIGAALEKPCFMEVICDGIHLHPAIIRFLFQTMPEKVVLISDSMMAEGLCDGNYQLGGLEVIVKEGKATLENGTIAGSAINLYTAMCNAIQFGVKPEDAICSATYLPAKSIGKEQEVGSIRIGARADILVLRKDYGIQRVFIEGKMIL
jgi:N-acetylglucosamine-6-phosphate deacetylase